MSNVLTFRPRAPQAQPASAALPAAIRAQIEEAAQTALDTADTLLGILDRLDGDTDAEDTEPALAAPENHHGSQIVWLHGNGGDREAEAPETVPPVVVAEHVVIPFAPLPWRGSGNVVAAAGVALLEMVVGR
ncbi:hypothetical protein [Methylobacterium sp. WL6]|uniref:hypothetical protein n=1 Tax=Methylobacterium sp. WL6 TaxID=2603901 RepID=UPI0011C94F96|nr:hypothetical protein [Methylobacterium sp. WL6]TXN73401.1 hypothetical protein FV230_01115 [Methylobacterium sp. WL6]